MGLKKKVKRTNNDLHRKLKIEQHQPYKNRGWTRVLRKGCSSNVDHCSLLCIRMVLQAHWHSIVVSYMWQGKFEDTKRVRFEEIAHPRRTDNTMAKRKSAKGQTIIYTKQKTKDWGTRTPLKWGGRFYFTKTNLQYVSYRMWW